MFIVKDKNHDLPKSSDETNTHTQTNFDRTGAEYEEIKIKREKMCAYATYSCGGRNKSDIIGGVGS